MSKTLKFHFIGTTWLFLNLIFDKFIIVLYAKHLVHESLPPCIKKLVPQIVGNYTMKLANTKLSEFHFQFSIRSVYKENWREVAHNAQSAQIAQK